ncbi:hypothetical protein A2803_00075 [Candidatus Woesebacteria bacterium RIFCSPHIGHO2_01_FULL_44_21]|uniref:CBS domain-containing protein n=1 Tax=Candidatus Woesebacteria bacterium RIFCSPHIGHO2_01_FULL_44_21 TaxID=1802503 RepID=A0A1F7Z391_9BACT|nr:MAG: hypothetical protein A2803_00075 [Candidatus Woesebacteria bacterium RIFCSPHIGHO2_01_FULL_44_21]OGM71148.1 MAG: hypothetical protein A2897_02930 [Candidatus Woesebacteria bacterium RIFCSPLOWO2_01_FULL_44_24b]
MLVRDVMFKRVFTVNDSADFQTIVKLLATKKISGITVVNKEGKLVGVISEKDLLYKLFPSEKKFYKNIEYYKNFERIEHEAENIGKLTAKHIMTKNVITIEPGRHVLVACSLMIINNIRRLPVVDHGKLVGIVTMGSLYKHYLSSFFKK